MSSSIAYNSNCLGLLSELQRFLARAMFFSETVADLEARRHLEFS